jgi:predicted ATPase/DNA-binding CsgD family transcriptional regulator
MSADTVPGLGNLPAEPNSFVGRERDLGDLSLLLSNVRALTLCGPGGIGKSRLATRLGWQLADEFPDGVWFVELADYGDPVHAVRRVADVLGISEEPDRPVAATLVDALGGRELLLILDTCEHVVEAIADLVRDLVAGCPLIRLVATSREPLRVRGETVWRVPPLSLPGAGRPGPVPLSAASPEAADAAALAAQHEAIQLFVDRAGALRPGFALSAGNYSAIVQLCRTLDGVPLAIELAAARIRALSVEQIAARLDDRFRLLASGDRTAPPRQQTLQAAVDWSFDLLRPDEQILLRRLSVFSGWSLDMAEQVCADDRIAVEQVLDLLAALIDKSLVALEDELAGQARYHLLDTIRDYASAQLAAAGEQAEFRRRHRDYLLRLVEDVVGQAFVRDAIPWPEQVTIYHRLAAEQANLRAALACCVDDTEAEKGLRLCSALRSPWVVQGDVTEGLRWFGRFLTMPGRVPASVRARALMLAAELAFEHQDYLQARQRAATAVAMSTAYRAACPAGALRILALVALRAGRVDEALAQANAAVAAAREYADEWEEGLALSAEATVLARSGQLAGAQEAFEAALSLLTGNNGWGVAHTLYGLGGLARARGDNAAAIRHFSSALELFKQIGARTEIARSLAGIGWVCLASLDLPTAAASLSESLELCMATGQRLGIARGLEAFAALAVVQRDDVTAVRLEGASEVLREAVDPARSGSARGRLGALLSAAHQRLGPARTASLQAEGKRLSMHEAVRYALSSASAVSPAPPPADWTGQNAVVPPVPMSVLTAREQQIALLITRGLSNRAIADELVISPATAARHVANILGKLGLSSRAQVAAWTADRRTAGTGRGPG